MAAIRIGTAINVALDSRSDTIKGSWRLAPQRSDIEFRVGLLRGLFTVSGHFDGCDGRLDLSADPAVELTIDAASIQSGNRRRDLHLRSPDFFDAENHPHVRFVSDIVIAHGDALKVRGRLFARGQSIPLELEAQIRHVDGEAEIEAVTTAPHRELGMTYSPLGMISSRSELRVRCRLVPELFSAPAP